MEEAEKKERLFLYKIPEWNLFIHFWLCHRHVSGIYRQQVSYRHLIFAEILRAMTIEIGALSGRGMYWRKIDLPLKNAELQLLFAPNISHHLPPRPAPSQRLIHKACGAEKKDSSRFKQRSDLTSHCVRVDSHLRRRFSISNMLELFRNAHLYTTRDCGLIWRFIVLFDQTTCTCRGFHCLVNQTAILVLEKSGRLLA